MELRVPGRAELRVESRHPVQVDEPAQTVRQRPAGRQGRGRYDRDKLYDKPRKDIWLRPLRRDWQRTLNR